MSGIPPELIFENVHQLVKRLHPASDSKEDDFYYDFKESQRAIIAAGEPLAAKQAEQKLAILEDLKSLPVHPFHFKSADAVKIKEAYVVLNHDLMRKAVWDCFETYCYDEKHPLFSGPKLDEEKNQKIAQIIDGAFIKATAIEARKGTSDGTIDSTKHKLR